jgi:hypothetical protein
MPVDCWYRQGLPVQEFYRCNKDNNFVLRRIDMEEKEVRLDASPATAHTMNVTTSHALTLTLPRLQEQMAEIRYKVLLDKTRSGTIPANAHTLKHMREMAALGCEIWIEVDDSCKHARREWHQLGALDMDCPPRGSRFRYVAPIVVVDDTGELVFGGYFRPSAQDESVQDVVLFHTPSSHLSARRRSALKVGWQAVYKAKTYTLLDSTKKSLEKHLPGRYTLSEVAWDGEKGTFSIAIKRTSDGNS